MDDSSSIDATDLISMPLSCLEGLIAELDPAAPGTDFVLTVVRWAAVLLICSKAVLEGDGMQASVRRGFEMLSMLRAHAEQHRVQ